MFLIDAIKHNVVKKFKTCFIFLRDFLWKVRNKTNFASFRVMFSGGNKYFIQSKREKKITFLSISTKSIILRYSI